MAPLDLRPEAGAEPLLLLHLDAELLGEHRREIGPGHEALHHEDLADSLARLLLLGESLRQLLTRDQALLDEELSKQLLRDAGRFHVRANRHVVEGWLERLRFAAVAREYPTLLDFIGGTPVVRLQKVGAELGCTLLAKLEYMTPGGSNKDRIGLRMVEAAEAEGKLEPGGTIVEPTSGNTGVGLALAAAVKGYKLICVVPDKVATEKIALLRAFGAEVVICPTAVDPDSPESYYSVSDRLAEEIPGAYKPDQYSNQANPEAHYHSTGPEIWEQVGDDLDALVISVGTGGSITGAGRYLKEQKPDLVVVGADPEGSVFTAEDESDVHPYLVEGIGKDTFPETFDPSIVDEYVRVSDRDSFLTARRLAREEGILGGGSAGTSVYAMLETARRHGPGKTILTTIPDGGRGYLSKLFDDNWMLEHGLLERRGPLPTIDEVLAFKHAEDGATPDLVVCEAHQKIGAAIELMQRYGISQLPVVRRDPPASLTDVIGSLNERGLLDRVFRNPDSLGEDVAGAMDPPLHAVDAGESVRDVYGSLSGTGAAVLVARSGAPAAVLTRSDLLEYLAHGRAGTELPVAPPSAAGDQARPGVRHPSNHRAVRRQPPLPAAVGVHDVDLEVVADLARERDLLPVGRPGRTSTR